VHRIVRNLALVAAAAIACSPQLAAAQAAWPQKPVRVIVPANPGGAADVLARRVAIQLEADLRQPFVVENRPGGGALIGTQAVVKSAADGYTLLVHGVGGHVIRTSENPNALDADKDFTHIAYFGGVPVMFAVNPSVPASDLKSLIAHVKSTPAGLSWGSPGVGTRSHIVGELLREATGTQMVHVPYKGAAQAGADLIANHISAASMTLSSIKTLLDAKKIRPIAVSSFRRLPAYPDVPTFAEAGFPKLTGSSWFGMSGPPGMARGLTDRINVEVNRALAAPEVAKAFADGSFETAAMTSAEFTKFFLAEIALLAPYMK
jgi:tripartite-type tricarboxylate transporter receptor subunit TctC